jgi:hypothetical protein
LREPEDFNPQTGLRTPYSRVPTAHLKNYARNLCSDGSPLTADHVSQDEFCDTDFRRRYAAILIRERGG